MAGNPVNGQRQFEWTRSHLDWLWAVSLWGVSLPLFFLNLDGVALRDWDEGIVAQVARSIGQSYLQAPDQLHWLFPTLMGEPYLNKPPLIHWLIALTASFGGGAEWTARFPGTLLTSLSVPLLYWIGRELLALRSAAVLSALVYLTLLPVVRHGRLAMLDGGLTCFFLGMLLCLLRTRRDLRWGLGVGVAFGLMGLTKGMAALLLGGVAIAFVVWDTPRLLTSVYVWSGFGLGCVPLIAWYVGQWQHYGELFWQAHVLSQSVNRVWDTVERNSGPLWYYGLELLKYTAPWVLFLPQGLRSAWDNRALSWAKLTLVWLIGYGGLISVMQTKLPWYGFPLYPAIALLVGSQLAQIWQPEDTLGGQRLLSPPYPRVWVGGMGLLAILLWPAAGYFLFGPQLHLDIHAILLATALTLTVATLLAVRRNSQFIAVLIWGLYVALLLFVRSPIWLWELNEAFPVKPIATLIQSHTAPNHVIYTSYPYYRPSLNFYSDRRVQPTNDDTLREIWHRSASPYVLLTREALQTLRFSNVRLLDQVELENRDPPGMVVWLLVTRDKPAASPKTSSHKKQAVSKPSATSPVRRESARK